MTGWEFAKHFVDTIYEHWAITTLFMLCSANFKPLLLNYSKKVITRKENEK